MNEHFTFYGYDENGNKLIRPKKSYQTEIDAQRACYIINLRPESIHKSVCYKCPKCNKWHIGHHKGKELNDKEREKIKKAFDKFKLLYRK